MVIFKKYDFDITDPGIENIIRNDITGIIINNVLSENECDEILKIIPRLKDDYFTDLNDQNGYSLPSMFGQLHKSQPYQLATKYFNDIITLYFI